MSVGESIGSVAKLETLLPYENISTVQTLVPRNKSESRKTSIAELMAFLSFPSTLTLHIGCSRPDISCCGCKSGSSRVSTRLLASSKVVSIVGEEKLNRALVRPRRLNGMVGCSCYHFCLAWKVCTTSGGILVFGADE